MSAPAALAAIPLLAGVVAGALTHALIPFALAALAAAWLAAVLALLTRRRLPLAIACAAGCCASGLAIGEAASRTADAPPLVDWFRASAVPDGPVHLRGTLRDDAVKTSSGVGLTIDVTDAAVGGRSKSLAGGARLNVTGTLALDAAPTWRQGRPVALDALLREPLDYRDPGVPSDRHRLARQDLVLLGSVKSGALVSLLGRGSPLDECASALRAWVRTATASAVGRWSPKSAGVVTAILIGDRTGLDVEDERRLQEAGTYHVIAISGGNVALLTALLVALGRALRLRARTTAAASIVLVVFYGYTAGLAPSVLRATLGGVVYLAARVVDHRGSALNALAVAAAFAAATAPLTILDPGFILSFGATVGIMAAASRLAPPLPRERAASRARFWTRRLLAEARALGAATICAEIALAPIGALLFGRVSPAGLVLNFAAIPLMSIIEVAGLIAVTVAVVSSRLAAACGWVAHIGTVGLLWSATLVDVAPWLVLDLPPPAIWLIVAWYAGLMAVLFTAGRRMRYAAIGFVMAAGTLLIWAPPWARAYRVPPVREGWTRVVSLDVGQGDATLVWPAGARPFLIDAGGAPGSAFDVGRRVTVPAAWAFGVTRLGRLVLTHGDPDHIGGAPAVLRALKPLEIWEGIPVPRHEPMQHLRALASAAGVSWIDVRAGRTLTIGSAAVRILNPPDPDWERQKVRNDDSIVMEVRIGDVAFVLPGDISQAVEASVAARLDPAPVMIVKAPHHGSAGSSSQPFIDATHPAAVIFSAGRRNPFGHPSAMVVARYRRAGAHVFSTRDEGAVVVDTNGTEVAIWTWTGRRDVLVSRPGARADGGAR